MSNEIRYISPHIMMCMICLLYTSGPFVSYTTVDTATNRVFTLDCYVYAPDLNKPRKRNYMRGLEHLLYSVRVPRQ